VETGGVSDLERRLRETEALNLITNRILMDYLSLKVDAGDAALEGVKRLIAFSADEVLRGSPEHEKEVRFFEKVMIDRFDETFSNDE
jgi:hypothetical protein